MEGGRLSDVVFTFGKHKGMRPCDVPEGYLRWLVQNVTLYGELDREVRRLLGEHVPSRPSVEERIDAVVRSVEERLQEMEDEGEEV